MSNEGKTKMEFLKDWGDALTRGTKPYIPDALVIDALLTSGTPHGFGRV